MAVAAGSGIAWGGKEALEAWQRSRADVTPEASVDRQRATIGRLAQMFPRSVKTH